MPLTANQIKVLTYLISFMLFTGLIFGAGFWTANNIRNQAELAKKEREAKLELENALSASVSLSKYVEIMVKTENAFTDTLEKIAALKEPERIVVEKTKIVQSENPEIVYVPIEYCPNSYFSPDELGLFNNHASENPK